MPLLTFSSCPTNKWQRKERVQLMGSNVAKRSSTIPSPQVFAHQLFVLFHAFTSQPPDSISYVSDVAPAHYIFLTILWRWCSHHSRFTRMETRHREVQPPAQCCTASNRVGGEGGWGAGVPAPLGLSLCLLLPLGWSSSHAPSWFMLALPPPSDRPLGPLA